MATPVEFNFTETGYYAPADPVELDFGATSIAVFTVLAGTSTNFNSVWADPDANINSSRMYAASRGTGAALSVVNLEHHVLVDSYSMTNDGINEEYLDSEDIVDINVNTAGV